MSNTVVLGLAGMGDPGVLCQTVSGLLSSNAGVSEVPVAPGVLRETIKVCEELLQVGGVAGWHWKGGASERARAFTAASIPRGAS